MDIEEAPPDMRDSLTPTSDLSASIKPVSFDFKFDMTTVCGRKRRDTRLPA